MIFRRRRPGRHAADGDIFTESPVPGRTEDDEGALEEYVGGLAGDEAPAREGGPYDAADAPPDDTRIDLGSLKIPRNDGVEIRLQASGTGETTDVLLVAGDSALQLGAYAAPRTEGIWNEVRRDLSDSISLEGGTVEEVEGRFGPELRARVRTPNGPAHVRFIGVDGPRWFLRGLYQGRAAADASAGAPLDACFDKLVVERDKEARPVREPLPLRLPAKLAEQLAARQAPNDGEGEGSVNGRRAPQQS